MTRSRPGNCFRSSAGLRATAVATADDGLSAIAAITRSPQRFGIVITDLQLPGADGFDVLTSARQANPSGYVVMITGDASIDSAVGAVREGAYDYLAKPFALGSSTWCCDASRTACRLEEENRDLARRVSGHEGHGASGDLT